MLIVVTLSTSVYTMVRRGFLHAHMLKIFRNTLKREQTKAASRLLLIRME